MVGVDRWLGFPGARPIPEASRSRIPVTVGGFSSGIAGHDTSTRSGSVSTATEELAVVSALALVDDVALDVGEELDEPELEPELELELNGNR